MRYSGSLVKKERGRIFSLFLEHDLLRFNEIEKALKLRSNMVSYHLSKMIEEGLIKKQGESYSLTAHGETFLPHYPHIVGQTLSPLPVVLVAVLHRTSILLLQRNRRPYKDYWGLIGGRVRHHETIEQAGLRLVKEKAGLDGDSAALNALLQEHVEGGGMVKHSFLLFLTTVQVNTPRIHTSEFGNLCWFDPKHLGNEQIIPSDLWLIHHKLHSRLHVPLGRIREERGTLTSFDLLADHKDVKTRSLIKSAPSTMTSRTSPPRAA